jgi:hypothetical protein
MKTESDVKKRQLTRRLKIKTESLRVLATPRPKVVHGNESSTCSHDGSDCSLSWCEGSCAQSCFNHDPETCMAC